MDNHTEKQSIGGSEMSEGLRAYHQPRLTKLGAIQELVQASGSGVRQDSGNFDAAVS